MKNDQFIHKFGELPDDQWLEVIINSLSQRTIDGVKFPSFPDESVQTQFCGCSGADVLRQAWTFYREIKNYAGFLGNPVHPQTRILDFGVGWGRLYRFFSKDVSAEHLLGVDIDPDCVNFCRTAMPWGTFEFCKVGPPLRFFSGIFDIIYAYSVFSHLNESDHLTWLSEFSRILRPGGMLIVTTCNSRHIGQWEKYLIDCRKLNGDEWWQKATSLYNFDPKIVEAALLEGKVLHYPTGGGGPRTPDHYGVTIIPETYVKKEWVKFFNFVDYVDDPNRDPQTIIVMTKA